MIPKKVRKVLSIMIAVALVMAVIPAVAFADEVNTLFGNGDETVASTGDATESEAGEQEAAAIGQDENAPQNDETIATDETGAENVADTQPEDAAQTDTTVELAKIRSNGGNLDSLTGLKGLNAAPAGFDESKLKVSITYSESDYVSGQTPVYFDDNTVKGPKVLILYDGGAIPDKYQQYVSDTYLFWFNQSYTGTDGQPHSNFGELTPGYFTGQKGDNELTVEILKGSSELDSKSISFKIEKRPTLVITFNKNYPGSTYSDDKHSYVDWGNTIDSIPTFDTTPKCEILSNTWYTDKDCTQAFDFSTKITKDYDLYADWTTSHTTGTLTHHDEVPSTCAATGTVEYWQCSVCGRYYSDQAGSEANEIAAADLDIPRDDNAHDWEQPTYQWENDNSAVTASRVCKNDASHGENEKATTTSEVTKKATCLSPEEITYTAEFTNALFETQTKTVVGDVDPDAHDWGEVTYKWANDNSSVTAIRTCKNDISHNETETVKTTKTVTKEATETAPGDILYSAEFSNPAFKKQTKYEEIPAKGTSETKKSDEPVDDDAFYVNASGDKITWTVGSNETLNIKFERSEDNASTSSHFLGIEVDGKATSKDLYDTEDGSIIIKLKPALLESLGEGEHTLTALFDDGSASAKFTIIKATKEVKNEKKTTSKNAKTGDSSPLMICIIVMLLSIVAIITTIIIKKKKH